MENWWTAYDTQVNR